jgi:hypothetical protein
VSRRHQIGTGLLACARCWCCTRHSPACQDDAESALSTNRRPSAEFTSLGTFLSGTGQNNWALRHDHHCSGRQRLKPDLEFHGYLIRGYRRTFDDWSIALHPKGAFSPARQICTISDLACPPFRNKCMCPSRCNRSGDVEISLFLAPQPGHGECPARRCSGLVVSHVVAPLVGFAIGF